MIARRGTSRLSRGRRRLLDGIALGLWLTGLVWLVSHTWFPPAGEFGPAVRPLDGWLLMAHGAFGFGALWAFGLLWGVHIPAGWGQRRRRVTGGTLFAGITVLATTGYGLYYCGDETLRPVLATTHWALGLAAPGFLLAHRFARRRRG